MAPSDDAMEDRDSPGEAQKMSPGDAKSYDTFHRYLHLPFELRAPIRAFAIEDAIEEHIDLHTAGLEDDWPCSRLASVSKEWQGDVERALFSKIRLDPFNEEDVSAFELYFTDRRKKYLTHFEVAVDDSIVRRLLEKRTGLLDIGLLMEKTGQLFRKLREWDFSGEGGKQRSIAIMFMATKDWVTGFHPPEDWAPEWSKSWSLWDPDDLSIFTMDGIPTNVVLWAIKSEFPSSLDMVTHLTFAIDCVPIAAAKRIVQVMPNLESCTFETHFWLDVEAGWANLTDFIHQLRASVPSLRKLKLTHHTDDRFEVDVPASMVEFAHALRELSQSLESLYVWPFHLHETFFLPFSKNADADAVVPHCNWPNLQHLTLRDFSKLYSSRLGGPTLSSVDILLAASKATLVMPNLKSMDITTPGGGHLKFDPENLEIGLGGFNEDEEGKIMSAYAPSISAEAKLIDELDYDDDCYRGHVRSFKWST